MRKLLAILLVLIVAFALNLGTAGANGDEARGRKIVVFQPQVVNEPAKDEIVQRAGGEKIKSLPLVNAAVVLAGPASERALRDNPNVLRVEDDGLVSIVDKPEDTRGPRTPTPTPTPARTPRPTPTPPPQVLPWGVDRIDADLAWGTTRGGNINVAVLDTGIDLTHSDLKVYGGINTINPRKNANDDNGHGTHVAGIIAALDNSTGVIGVAPEAHLYAVKVLSSTGSGWWSDVIEGLQWSIDNGMQVVNMSFGASSAPQTVWDAIKLAYAADIVLVAAAGNSGPGDNTVIYPAKYPEVIAVSATDSSDKVPSWSSCGPEVELASPGVNIYSTYKGNRYATLSGTSMASPHTAGTAALVIATGITPNTYVRTLLQSTADDRGADGWDSLYGYGITDAQEPVTGTDTNP